MSDHALPENLRYLIEEFNRSGLRELHLRKGDFELLLSHTDHAQPRARPVANAQAPAIRPAPVTSQAAPAAPAPKPAATTGMDLEGATIVTAPNLGTFYRSPKPGSPPFVELGQAVSAGTELCLIEVMKLFTTVRSSLSGTIVAVLVEDGAMVEADQPLFAIRED